MKQTTQIVLVCGAALLSGWSQVSQKAITNKDTCTEIQREVKNLDLKLCMSDVSHFNFGFKSSEQIYEVCSKLNEHICLE